MAVSVVQAVRGQLNNATSVAVTISATTAGNTIAVTVSAFNNTVAASQITDNKGGGSSTYVLPTGGEQHVNTAAVTGIVYVTNCAAGITQVTYNPTGGAGQFGTVVVYELGNVATASVDKAVSGSGTGTAVASGSSGTLTQADEIGIGVCSTDFGGGGTQAVTETAPWVLDFEDETSNITQNSEIHQIVSATTALNAQWTLGLSQNWGATLVTFKGGAAAVAADYSGPAITDVGPLSWLTLQPIYPEYGPPPTEWGPDVPAVVVDTSVATPAAIVQGAGPTDFTIQAYVPNQWITRNRDMASIVASVPVIVVQGARSTDLTVAWGVPNQVLYRNPDMVSIVGSRPTQITVQGREVAGFVSQYPNIILGRNPDMVSIVASRPTQTVVVGARVTDLTVAWGVPNQVLYRNPDMVSIVGSIPTQIIVRGAEVSGITPYYPGPIFSRSSLADAVSVIGSVPVIVVQGARVADRTVAWGVPNLLIGRNPDMVSVVGSVPRIIVQGARTVDLGPVYPNVILGRNPDMVSIVGSVPRVVVQGARFVDIVPQYPNIIIVRNPLLVIVVAPISLPGRTATANIHATATANIDQTATVFMRSTATADISATETARIRSTGDSEVG